MENKLIAKKGKYDLYYDETIATAMGTKLQIGHITDNKGKTFTVDIDKVLAQSNWDLINPNWQKETQE